MIGLAKRIEEVFVPGRSEPIDLAARLGGLRLLQRVRDEAHRFAIDLHRGRRDQAMTGSVLDELQGRRPGAQARPARSTSARRSGCVAASREELEAVPGVPGKLAREIHRQLNKTGR